MKKTLKSLVIVGMIGLSLVGGTQAQAKTKIHKQYEAMSYVTKVEKTKGKNCIVSIQVESGDIYKFIGYAKKGEWLILTMDNNGTKSILDDTILDVREDEE